MRSKLIYDADELVVLRRYDMEGLAALDQAILEAADIPSIVRHDRGSEQRDYPQLIVRREHQAEALEVLAADHSADAATAGDPPEEK